MHVFIILYHTNTYEFKKKTKMVYYYLKRREYFLPEIGGFGIEVELILLGETKSCKSLVGLSHGSQLVSLELIMPLEE